MAAKRVLVTYGSKRGGTRGIAEVIGEALRCQGADVVVCAARKARPRGFDAVIVGGGLYANRWHHSARGFVLHHRAALRKVPVWFFSSGPLDDSTEHVPVGPTRSVRCLMERVGALEHRTFGGRLAADARGFPASAMAKKHAGDWRQMDLIRAWASRIGNELPTARPGVVQEQRGQSAFRLVAYGVLGWVLCAATMGALLALTSERTAQILHALAAPAIFAVLACRYFRPDGAKSPLAAALTFTASAATLDLLVVAGLIRHSLDIFRSVEGTWLPLLSIFVVSWGTGELMSMLPDAQGSDAPRTPPAGPFAGFAVLPGLEANSNHTP